MRTSIAFVVALAVGCGAKSGLTLCEDTPDACCPVAESCNGIDDDCDGVVDDGVICFFLDGERIQALEGASCGADWYSYDVPDPESANPTPDIRVSGGVVVGAQWRPECEGANVFVIADLPMDGTGGELNVAWQIEPPISAGLIVGDEPRECAHDAFSGVGGCEFVWQACCTDGFLLGPWTTDGCVTMTLSGAVGVTPPVVIDGEGTAIPRRYGEPFQICSQLRPAFP